MPAKQSNFRNERDSHQHSYGGACLYKVSNALASRRESRGVRRDDRWKEVRMATVSLHIQWRNECVRAYCKAGGDILQAQPLPFDRRCLGDDLAGASAGLTDEDEFDKMQWRKRRKMTKAIILATCAVCALPAFCQAVAGRDAFIQQQAYAEMQRVSGLIDVLQNNIDDLAQRISKLERANSSDETAALSSRIAALEGTVASLRRELQQQRGEIVKDLSSRIAKMPRPKPQPAQQAKEQSQPDGPYKEYVVATGDNLWLIARAFNTSVSKIREMNNLKNDSLKIGQTLKLPVEQGGSK